MSIRRHIRVAGRVQGVAFRASTRTQAATLGLRGWVANRADGSVEVVAEGDDAAMAKFIEWCHHGPAAARVTRVEVCEEPAQQPLPEPFAIHT